jgi:hypothetical protein
MTRKIKSVDGRLLVATPLEELASLLILCAVDPVA